MEGLRLDLGRLAGSPLQFHLPSPPGNGPEHQTPVLSPLGHHKFHPAEPVVTMSLFLPISDIATVHAETGSNFVSPILAMKFFIQCSDPSSEYIWNPSTAGTLALSSSPPVC